MWKTLFRTYQNLKKKPMFNDLNPKAVTNDELYGIINPATRDAVQCCREIHYAVYIGYCDYHLVTSIGYCDYLSTLI